jgi:hypothetical protein
MSANIVKVASTKIAQKSPKRIILLERLPPDGFFEAM